MVTIDKTEFGYIVVDGKRYDHDVIITPTKVVEARTKTRHEIGVEEFLAMLKEKPEIIVIGTGQYGKMSVSQSFTGRARLRRIETIIETTPQAIERFNSLTGKKVVAYMHVTC
jgi:hypothetical protein